MSELTDELIADARDRMGRSVQATQGEFGSVRTGRASPQLLDRVTVDYYGAMTPLKQLATINVPEARMVTIQPFDKSSMKAIEKGIVDAQLGLAPSNDGNIVRLVIPELTEERRKDLVKMVRAIAEEGRVAIRNVRRDIMHDLRELRDEGEVGADDEHRAEVELQKLTDDRIAELDGLLKGKVAEILEGCRRRGGRRAALRRDHHGRQRPLGQGPRQVGRGRPPGRCRRRQGPAARRGRAGHPRADRLLVLDRELVALARRGRRAHAAVQ